MDCIKIKQQLALYCSCCLIPEGIRSIPEMVLISICCTDPNLNSWVAMRTGNRCYLNSKPIKDSLPDQEMSLHYGVTIGSHLGASPLICCCQAPAGMIS